MAQSSNMMDGSVRGRGRLFGPVMTRLNPLLYIFFLIKEREREGGGPSVLI